MRFIYRLCIWLYGKLAALLSPFYKKAKLFYKGRQQVFQKLSADFEETNGPVIWFHAASVGEFEQGRPIMEQLKVSVPAVQIVLTFFSPSGYELRKNSPLADFVYYLPLDTRRNARLFLSTIKPKLAVFIKYEFWYFYLEQLQVNKTPTLIVSAVFRQDQWFFGKMGYFLWEKIKRVDCIMVQDEASGKLLMDKGADNVVVVGDTRFDRVWETSNDPQEVEGVRHFKNGFRLMALGSIWPEDMERLKPFICSEKYNLKWIIAPHEMSKRFLAELDRLPGSVRYTSYVKNTDVPADILVLDCVGKLASCYQYSDFAYVGGGFRGALHNILEPAAFGQPVFFGDHVRNKKFLEAEGLKMCGGAISFSRVDDFETKFQQLWEDDRKYFAAAEASRKFVEKKTGATAMVVKKIVPNGTNIHYK